MALEYFCCFHSYAKKLAKLSDQEVGRLFRALLQYSESGETQELAGRESVAFDFIAYDIDKSKQAYEEKSRANSENARRRYEGERPQANAYDRMRPHATASERIETNTKSKTETETNMTGTEGDIRARAKPPTPAVGVVLSAYLDKINPAASQYSLDELAGYVEALGEAVCLRAIDKAVDEKKATWSYLRGILRSLQADGVRCLADWEARERRREEQRGRTGPNHGAAGEDSPSFGTVL